MYGALLTSNLMLGFMHHLFIPLYMWLWPEMYYFVMINVTLSAPFLCFMEQVKFTPVLAVVCCIWRNCAKVWMAWDNQDDTFSYQNLNHLNVNSSSWSWNNLGSLIEWWSHMQGHPSTCIHKLEAEENAPREEYATKIEKRFMTLWTKLICI